MLTLISPESRCRGRQRRDHLTAASVIGALAVGSPSSVGFILLGNSTATRCGLCVVLAALGGGGGQHEPEVLAQLKLSSAFGDRD